jgi:hypothetical protein
LERRCPHLLQDLHSDLPATGSDDLGAALRFSLETHEFFSFKKNGLDDIIVYLYHHINMI